MSHDHNHHHRAEGGGARMVFTILLNISITVAQVVGGLLSGSLALLADALHNFSDVVALVVSYIALRMARRPQSVARTYGYKRAETLAALFNGAVLIAIAVNLCIEAIGRFGQAQSIDSVLVMALAGYSIAANGLSVLVLQRDAENSLNMRSAYLHLLSDMLTSIAVLAGGAAMYFWQLPWLDGVLSIAISLYLIYMSGGLLSETIKVVMQFTPGEVNMEAVERDILKIAEVENLHHAHLWRLTDDEIHFQAHIGFACDLPLSRVTAIIDELQAMLAHRHRITHTILQAEFGSDHATDTVLEHC